MPKLHVAAWTLGGGYGLVSLFGDTAARALGPWCSWLALFAVWGGVAGFLFLRYVKTTV